MIKSCLVNNFIGPLFSSDSYGSVCNAKVSFHSLVACVLWNATLILLVVRVYFAGWNEINIRLRMLSIKRYRNCPSCVNKQMIIMFNVCSFSGGYTF